jgi:tetratricopeptide (TPR) repeat protein
MQKAPALAILSLLALTPHVSAQQSIEAQEKPPADSLIWDHVRHLEEMIQLWPKREYYLELADLYGRVGESDRELELYEVAYNMGWLDQTRQFVQLAQLLLRARKLPEADKALQDALDSEAAKASTGDIRAPLRN